MQKKAKAAGGSLFGVIAAGIILVLMGVPFIGMALMIAMLVRESNYGLPLALATLFVVYLISDFTGALIAATGAGMVSALLRTGRSFRISIAAASAATVLASIFGTVLLPQHSLLSGDNIEALMQLYSSTGMKSSEILLIMNILLYILPALLALWATAGVIASAVTARMISRRRGLWPDLPEGSSLKLGLFPAWVLIGALALNLAGGNISPYLRQASVNICIFMILPYTAVGLSVVRKAMTIFPQSLLLAVLVGVIFPPLGIGVLMLVGILDTWFDFRTRLGKIDERKMNNESSTY